MNIQGLQKLTLLDYPDKVACTIFTAGCNFRCPFCHNASLVTQIDTAQTVLQQDVFSFLTKRQGLLDGVCITGGEPLLQPDIEAFIREIKSLGYAVKLDTNGSNSQKLIELVERGLVDYVAMDIKNTLSKYGKTIGIEGYCIEQVKESVEYLLKGNVSYEFRTTVVRELHKREDFAAIGSWIRGAQKYYLQRFVDSGDLIQSGLHPYSKEIMEQALQIVKQSVKMAELRGVE